MYVSLSHAVLSKKIISYSPFILVTCSCIPSKWINFPLHLSNFGADNGHLRREKLHVRIQCSSGYSIICIWWQSLFSVCNRNMWRENGFTSNSVPLSHIKKASPHMLPLFLMFCSNIITYWSPLPHNPSIYLVCISSPSALWPKSFPQLGWRWQKSIWMCDPGNTPPQFGSTSVKTIFGDNYWVTFIVLSAPHFTDVPHLIRFSLSLKPN